MRQSARSDGDVICAHEVVPGCAVVVEGTDKRGRLADKKPKFCISEEPGAVGSRLPFLAGKVYASFGQMINRSLPASGEQRARFNFADLSFLYIRM